TQGDLQTTQGDLQTTQGTLQTTQGTLQTTQGTLQTTQGDLKTANAAASAALRTAARATSQAADALSQASIALKVARTKTLEAKSIDLALLATEPDRLHGDLQLALLLGREAARLDEQSGAHSPTVRDALLELGLESSRGLRRFLQVPNTSSGGPQPTVVMRNGRVAYGSLTTNHIVVFDPGSSLPTRDLDAGGPVLDVALGADNDVLVADIPSDPLSDELRLWDLAHGDPGEVLCTGSCGITVGPGGRTIAIAGPTENLFVDGIDPRMRIPFVGTLGTGDVTPPPPPGGTPGLTAATAVPAAAPPVGPPPPPGSNASAVSPFSSDGRWVLGRARDAGNGLVLWDLEHRANRIVLDTVVGSHVDNATFDASGTALALAINGTSVARLELSDTPRVGPVTNLGSTVTTVAASSDGAVAAATDDGRVVYVGALRWESSSVPDTVTTLAFSPKGKVLAAAGNGPSLTLLDTTDAGLSGSARIVGSLPGADRAWFSTDETVAFLETVDLGVSNVSAPAALTVLALGRQANGPIGAIAPTVVQVVDGGYRQFEQTPDASLLVGVGDRADVFRLDSSAWIRTTPGLPTSNVTPQSWGTLAGASRMLADMAIDRDGTVVAIARDGFGAVWDPRDFAPGTFVDGPPPNPEPPPFGVASVTSPDLRLVARSTGTGVELLDRATGLVDRTLQPPGSELVVGMRFSPSGSYVLACTGTLHPPGASPACEHTIVWRTADGALVAQLAAIAVVSGDDSTVAQWDSSAGQIEVYKAADLEAHRAPFRRIPLGVFPLADTAALTLDGDGSRLAITNGWMHFVWDTATGNAVGTGLGILPGPDAGSKVKAALSADGLVLAVQGSDGGVQLWDLGAQPKLRGPTSGSRTCRTARCQLPGTLHSSELALNADGSLLATDNPVRVWDTKALRQIGPTFLESNATALQIVPGSGTLVVGLGDGPDAAELFTLNRAQLLDDACRLAGRSLTEDEWTAFGIPLPFAPACP
nr:WD40 repeat domain-containing protein [Actinomycetota bacterium]